MKYIERAIDPLIGHPSPVAAEDGVAKFGSGRP
jgi:hypothetical protein